MGFKADGRLVVISGGSQGLGLSLACVFASKGANVVIVARTAAKLQTAAAKVSELKVRETQSVRFIPADVSKPDQCVRVFEEIGEVPDMVICCAGGAIPGLLVDIEPEQLRSGLTGYETALYFSHAALRVVAKAPDHKQKERYIVLCSSILALFPFIGYGSYAPAKAAIRSFADILRQEGIRYNLKVSHIIPGNMDTEGFEIEERTKPEITRIIEGKSTPLNPDDVAADVVRKLEGGAETIFTDTIGWILSGLAIGASPRVWAIPQTLIAIILILVSPIWLWTVKRDIRGFFAKQDAQKQVEADGADGADSAETVQGEANTEPAKAGAEAE